MMNFTHSVTSVSRYAQLKLDVPTCLLRSCAVTQSFREIVEHKQKELTLKNFYGSYQKLFHTKKLVLKQTFTAEFT